MTGTAVDYTPNFKLSLPSFDLRLWHTYVNEDFAIIDAVLAHYLNVDNLTGVWRNSTIYQVGQRAVDPTQGSIWECKLGNTSAPPPTTFAQERASNPAYWGGVTVPQTFRGTWANSTSYSINDFVVSGNIYAVCATSHTSIALPGVFGDDVVYWIYLINLAGNVLPSITGHGSAYIRARPDETAVEYRTPAQVKADLGISNMVTSFNTRAGDVLLSSVDINNAGGIVQAGGTMTGPLVVPSNAVTAQNPSGFDCLRIDGIAGTGNGITGSRGGVNRWRVVVGNSTAEGGSNTGSDFVVLRYNDAGASIDTPFQISRATGVTSFGGVGWTYFNGVGATPETVPAVTAGNVSLRLNKASNTSAAIAGLNNAVPRWNLVLGNGTAESGSNAGSDFALQRFTDAGSLIDTPFSITRSTGAVLIPNSAQINSSLGVTGTVTTGSAFTISKPSGQQAMINYQATRSWQVGQQTDGTFLIYDVTAGASRVIIDTAGVATFSQSPVVSVASGNALLTLNAPIVTGNQKDIVGMAGGLWRWILQLGDGAAETGSNAGNDLSFTRYNDAGTIINKPLVIQRSSGSVILDCNAQVFPNLHRLDGAAGTSRILLGTTASVIRWLLNLGNNVAESGSNNGSDFQISCYSDAGAFLNTAIGIKRSTAVCTFAVAIVNGPSDRTLKENIEPLYDALDKVMALQGVRFNFIATPDKPEIGLIAQDVEPVVPEVIQPYSTGDEGSEPKLAIDYPKLTALLIEAVKELSARVEILEARLA